TARVTPLLLHKANQVPPQIPSTNLPLMERVPPSAPLRAQVLTSLLTAQAISTQPMLTAKLSTNLLPMERGPFSRRQTRSRPAPFPWAWLLTVQAISLCPPKATSRETTPFSCSLQTVRRVLSLPV